jgi:hypothetical protein
MVVVDASHLMGINYAYHVNSAGPNGSFLRGLMWVDVMMSGLKRSEKRD